MYIYETYTCIYEEAREREVVEQKRGGRVLLEHPLVLGECFEGVDIYT